MSRTRLLVALSVTFAAVPLLLVWDPGASSDDDGVELGVPAAGSVEGPTDGPGPTHPPKGASIVPTETVEPATSASSDGEEAPTSIAAGTLVTRPIRSTTTTVERSTVTTDPPPPAPVADRRAEGQASWFVGAAGTCAHRDLPLDTVVRVTNVATGASTECTVSHRGPYAAGRVIDLARETFADLAPPREQLITVRLEW